MSADPHVDPAPHPSGAARWQARFDAAVARGQVRDSAFTTLSGAPVEPVYGPGLHGIPDLPADASDAASSSLIALAAASAGSPSMVAVPVAVVVEPVAVVAVAGAAAVV